jgi:hypothetical protein
MNYARHVRAFLIFMHHFIALQNNLVLSRIFAALFGNSGLT